MDLVLVRRQFSRHRSGAERMVLNLMRWLLDRGHRITAVGEGIDEELRSQVEFVAVEPGSTPGWSPTESFAKAAAARLKGLRRDWVHSMARVPGVDSFHALDPLHAYWLQVRYPLPLMRTLQSWNPRHRSILRIEDALFRTDATRQIIVQSRFDAEVLQQYYNVPQAVARVQVVPNGVDTSQFTPAVKTERTLLRRQYGLPETAPLLLFVSMDFRRKGLGELIAALALAPRDCQLVVVGVGPEGRYRQLARQHGVDQRVWFVGRQTEMGAWYGAADLFVLPTWYDPFASVVLEAMACGLPTLTTRRGGAAEAITPDVNGYLVDAPTEIEPMAKLIGNYLELDAVARGQICERAVASARRFTADEYARQTYRVIQEAAHAPRKAA